MATGKVSITILNLNTIDALGRCIESVRKQTYPVVDLWILDNNSTDGSVRYLQENYPDVNLHSFSGNLGFSKAHNYAIKRTDGAYYMPLNPDVVLDPCYVSEMVTAMESDDSIGSVAGKLLILDERSARGAPRIYSTGHLLTKSRSPTNRGYKERDIGQYDRAELVFAANGAAPLLRRKMLQDIMMDGGYFCEDFFVYGEDHDLGWRAQLRGWKCMYTPYAVGYHVGFGSGGMRRFRVQAQFTRNRYLTLARDDQWMHLLVDLPFILTYEVVWHLHRLFTSPRWLLAHWWGLLLAVCGLPSALRARSVIQASSRVKGKYIRTFFVSRLW